MMELAQHIGWQNAHDVVCAACRETPESKTSLFIALQGKNEIVEAVGIKKLESPCDPTNYLGASRRMVDDTLSLQFKG